MNEKFSISMCSDLDYEGMVIDVCYNMKTIAMINYDKGRDNLEIEITPTNDKNKRALYSLKDFFDILEKAKNLAIKCATEDKDRNRKKPI